MMTSLKITGMTCGHCRQAVTEALESVDGVDAVRVDLERGSAEVDGSADVKALVAAVEEEGYQASPAGTGG
jgi:copper chaperone